MIRPKQKSEDRIYSGLPDELKTLMRQYLLSDEEHARVLEDIKIRSYYKKKTSSNPKFVIVLGQTGAGKSKLSELVTKKNPNLVVIDSDRYKGYRKDSSEIQKKHLVEYAYLTAPDAYWHRDEMIYDAMRKKYNILMECATSEKDGMFVDVNKIASMGYNVEINVLCVSALNSLLSIHERYEDQIGARNVAAKLTSISRHDDSFKSLIQCIETIDEKNINVSAYKRGIEAHCEPIIIYSSKNGNWEYNSAVEALKSTQLMDKRRTMTEFEDRYATLNQKMISRNAPSAQIKQLKNVYERYLMEKNKEIYLIK